MSEMSLNELARDFLQARQEADWLYIGNPGWGDAKAKELGLAEKIRHWLLLKPLVLSDDLAVTQILQEIDLGDFHDPYKIGLGLLHDLIRPEEYVASLAEIILIVPVGTQIPEHLHSLFNEARQCYALGQYSAVQSLCRTILESTDAIGIRTGEWTEKQLHTPRFRRGYPFNDRVQLVAGKASGEKIYEFYKDLSGVVHGAATSANSGASGALAKTLGFVQSLYSRHKVEKA